MLKLIITDFDGTLVDTFEANFNAYKLAFSFIGQNLTEEHYRNCFGFRFDDFMKASGITDEEEKRLVRERKKVYYPEYFHLLKPNEGLLEVIRSLKGTGIKSAVASTAARTNLMNALQHIGAVGDFDLILSGESVTHGKPNPEIYQKVLNHFGFSPLEAVVFEDSDIGYRAANEAGIPVIRISEF